MVFLNSIAKMLPRDITNDVKTPNYIERSMLVLITIETDSLPQTLKPVVDYFPNILQVLAFLLRSDLILVLQLTCSTFVYLKNIK